MFAKSGKYQALVIGVSAGGIAALDQVLPCFGGDCPVSILIVQHMAADSGDYLVEHFAKRCRLIVKEAEDKEKIQPGTIYFAPPNYHLLVELERSLALSTQGKVNYSRPSIDVLFETAAQAYCSELVGVILTGANSDGSAGLAAVKRLGGATVVQSPGTAEADAMPKAAIAKTDVDMILPLSKIGPFLVSLNYASKE